jgi:predicted ATPase
LFLDEVHAIGRDNGIRVLRGSGNGLTQDTPYHAWKEIFQQFFQVDPFLTDRHTRRSQILRQLPPIRGERGFPAFAIRMAPLLNAVLPLDLPENRTTRKMAHGVRHKTTQQFLLRLLQRQVAGTARRKARPTVLILDNGQWMDPYSWELAIGISREVSSLLTIVATRPLGEQAAGEALSRSKLRLEQEDHVLRLTLEALSKPELADLLWHESGVQAMPEEVLEALFLRAGGRPTFTMALVRQWSELGLADIDGGVVRLSAAPTALYQTPLPESVRQVVTGRIERLSPAQQLILKVASVIGVNFSIRRLQELYPVKRDHAEIQGQLRALAESNILKPHTPDNEAEYQYSCNFYWQVSNSLLPLAQRLQLQRKLELLE